MVPSETTQAPRNTTLEVADIILLFPLRGTVCFYLSVFDFLDFLRRLLNLSKLLKKKTAKQNEEWHRLAKSIFF